MMSNYSISIRTFRTKNYCYSTTSPVQSTSSSASELQYIQYSHIGSHYLFSKKQCEQHVFASVHGHSSTLLVPVFTVHVLCVCVGGCIVRGCIVVKHRVTEMYFRKDGMIGSALVPASVDLAQP